MAVQPHLFIMINQDGKRAQYAQIAKSNGGKLCHYDIWPLDANPENTDFAAATNAIGSIYTARITKLDAKTKLAFLTLGRVDAVMQLHPKQNFTEGQYILAEIISDAYDDKSLRVRYVGDAKASDKIRPAMFKQAQNLAQHCLKLAKLDGSKLITDDFGFYAELQKQIAQDGLEINLDQVKFGKKNTLPLLDEYNLSEQIDELKNSRLTLKNGGNIIIEHTEAMTVVDVNSGNYTGNDMNHDINQQAAIKTFEQLKLRNVGGLVIVDFLKYKQKSDRQKFVSFLRELAQTNAIEIGSYTGFGLTEFKIKRTGKRLNQKLSEFEHDRTE